MKIFIKIIKGMLVGIGSILPGVSGSMIATTFNIYEELIDALNNFVKKPIKSIISVWEYALGVGLGLGFGIVLISKILKLFPFTISLLFIGLILGSIPSVLKEEKETNKKWYHYLITVIAITIGVTLLFVKPSNVNEITGFGLYVVYIVVGFLVAIPMIIPGISGATILLILGFYEYFTDTITIFITNLFKFDFSAILNSFLPVFFIVVSAFIGLVIFAKFMSYILKHHKSGFNFAILGLFLISPINVLYSMYLGDNNLFRDINVLEIIIGVVLFFLGISITYLSSKLEFSENLDLE